MFVTNQNDGNKTHGLTELEKNALIYLGTVKARVVPVISTKKTPFIECITPKN